MPSRRRWPTQTANAFEGMIRFPSEPTFDVIWELPVGSAADSTGNLMVSTLATNAPSAANSLWGGSNALTFEGATANEYEMSVSPADPGADVTLTLPAETSAVMVSSLVTNATDAANAVTGASNALVFEGATANEHEMSLSPADPGADVTLTLPAETSAVMVSSLVTNATDAANAVTGASNALKFEGTSADEHEGTVTVTNPTADRTWTFPDASGTVMLSSLATNGVDAANSVTGASNSLLFEGATANDYETSIAPTDPTADRTITLPDASGMLALTAESGYSFPLTADVVAQVGDLVMPDGGTANRFDVHTGSATMPLGVLAGTGPSVQGTSYPIVFAGLGRCAIEEDAAVTLAHWLIVSATAGKCNDSATLTTIGLNVGKALEAAPVTNVIAHNGCTGGTGCINTALDTPNTGPAGQITLGADVAAQGWAVGDPVIYWNSGGTTPTGLTDGKVYFLVSVATTNVTISATKGGAVVVPSTQGDDATQYLQKLPLAVIQLN